MDLLEGDVGEQRSGGADSGDATANVGQEGEDLLILWIYPRRHLRHILETRTNQWSSCL